LRNVSPAEAAFTKMIYNKSHWFADLSTMRVDTAIFSNLCELGERLRTGDRDPQSEHHAFRRVTYSIAVFYVEQNEMTPRCAAFPGYLGRNGGGEEEVPCLWSLKTHHRDHKSPTF
jgi:hypothetical protein